VPYLADVARLVLQLDSARHAVSLPALTPGGVNQQQAANLPSAVVIPASAASAGVHVRLPGGDAAQEYL